MADRQLTGIWQDGFHGMPANGRFYQPLKRQLSLLDDPSDQSTYSKKAWQTVNL